MALELLLDAVARGHPQTLVARGWSMSPAIPDGTVVELRAPEGPIVLGMVVAVTEPRLLLHRVVGLRSDGAVLLLGDTERRPDGWYRPAQVRAVVARLSRGEWIPVPPRQPPSRPKGSRLARLVRFVRR